MTINISLEELIVWLIIGGMAGAIAGMLVRDNKSGFGMLGNIIVGLIGALIGGFLFEALGISISSFELRLSLDALIAAVVGALILVLLLRFVRR